MATWQLRLQLDNMRNAMRGKRGLGHNIVPKLAVALFSVWLLTGCGGLKISSDPPGASVYVTGRLYGKTPCAVPAVAGPNQRVYKVVLEGYEIDSVRWRSGGLAMDFRLKPAGSTAVTTPAAGESGGGL